MRGGGTRSKIASKVHMHFKGRTICNLYLCIDVMNKHYQSRINEYTHLWSYCSSILIQDQQFLNYLNLDMNIWSLLHVSFK